MEKHISKKNPVKEVLVYPEFPKECAIPLLSTVHT